ncbi:MAG: LTA synthase family protein [Clostridia bacterium]|nr:LTA synthase family protein [Clostridia bacterium]
MINFKINHINSKKILFFAELSYYFLFLSSIMVKFFYFQFSSGASIRPYSHIANIKMLSVSFAVLLIISSFVMLFGKYRFAALFILDMFLTLILVSDTLYFRYFNNAITIPVLYQATFLDSLGESILNLVYKKDAVFIIDIPVFIAGLIFILKNGVRKINVKERLISTFALALTGIILYQLVVMQINTTMSRFDQNYTIKQRGIMTFHVEDIKLFLKENVFTKKSLTSSESKVFDSFFKNKASKDNKEKNFHELSKGKNIIVIQSEALQTFLINTTINGKEITPNLNRLIKDSAFFDNIYYQSATGKTADAEFITNNSLYAAKTGTAYIRFPNNDYYSLANILKNQNYKSYAFHAYDPGFWNRTVMYRSLGFNNFFSKKDFVNDDTISWGLSDKSFFRQSLDKLSGKDPFYAFMVTLSSHYPFDFFKDFDFNVGKYENTFFGNYLKGENYADSCIGILIDELKSRGIYDNTLLVIYGDHYGIPRLEAGSQLMDFSGKNFTPYEWTRLQKVPLIIHYPGLKNGQTLGITGGQVDILPTIANLMGFEVPYALGKDLFNSVKGYAVLRDGSVITDEYMYLSETTKVYDSKSGKLLDTEKYRKEFRSYQQELEISDIILQKNAFKKK